MFCCLASRGQKFKQILRGNISCTLPKVTKFYFEIDATQSTKVTNALLFGFSSFNWLCRIGVSPLDFKHSRWEVAMRAVNHQQSETFRAKIIGSFELQVSLWLADLIGISWGDIRKFMVLWQAVYLAASPLVSAPPPNLTRLVHNTASYAG